MTSAGNADYRADPASWRAPASKSSGASSNDQGALVESGHQRSARRRTLHQIESLDRLPRLKGLSRHSRLTESHKTHPSNYSRLTNSRFISNQTVFHEKRCQF